VPILSTNVEVEKVTMWHEDAKYPLRALWMTNSSGETLDAGTFNIVDAGAFAGEGVLEHIKPGEKRLLSYAVDQGVRIKTDENSETDRVTKVKVVRGIITMTQGYDSADHGDRASGAARMEDHQQRQAGGDHRKLLPIQVASGVKEDHEIHCGSSPYERERRLYRQCESRHGGRLCKSEEHTSITGKSVANDSGAEKHRCGHQCADITKEQ